MASPNEKLADSLSKLKALQDAGKRVIRGKDLSRTHQTRLISAGFLELVVKGWYLPARPGADAAAGGTAAWYAGIRDFIAGYCDERFGADWHLSPEQSLVLLSGERTLPPQLQIWAPKANNQPLQLPHGCSVYLYRTPKLLPSSPHPDNNGIRLVNLAVALVEVADSFFVQQRLTATICLGMVSDTAPLLQRLLDGGRSTVAGRLAAAFRVLGRDDFAGSITNTMRSAGYTVQESSPFDLPPVALPGGRAESPYVQRLRLMWADMRGSVIAAFPPPGPAPTDPEKTLREVEERYVTDAYHSLSIEGYRVTTDLIEKIGAGTWDPDGNDRQQRDAMAAKGYFEAHNQVKDFIGRTIAQGDTRPQRMRDALGAWYVALFSPSVQAGLLKPSDLAGWRNDQVFIRGAMHVPLSKEAVLDAMPALFDLIEAEEHPAVRAILGHLFFVYIHPYMDGNGRLARFLMNAMLVGGGYVWTIIPVEKRAPYMQALEQASSFKNIKPFAEFVAELTVQQSTTPLPRPAA